MMPAAPLVVAVSGTWPKGAKMGPIDLYLLKPIESGVDVKMTGGIHKGCLRVQVAKNSELKSVAELKGKTVAFALGKSHPIDFPIPEGIQVAVDKQTHIVVSGADKGQVGQVAADMRALRPPDPYKQKGVRITGERLKKKAGKAGAKAGGAAA